MGIGLFVVGERIAESFSLCPKSSRTYAGRAEENTAGGGTSGSGRNSACGGESCPSSRGLKKTLSSKPSPHREGFFPAEKSPENRRFFAY
jgi:hypothetical protein